MRGRPHSRTSSRTCRSPQKRVQRKDSLRYPQLKRRCRTRTAPTTTTAHQQQLSGERHSAGHQADTHTSARTHAAEPLVLTAWPSSSRKKALNCTHKQRHPRRTAKKSHAQTIRSPPSAPSHSRVIAERNTSGHPRGTSVPLAGNKKEWRMSAAKPAEEQSTEHGDTKWKRKRQKKKVSRSALQ
ncbi:hypothetical protein TcCL_NonESM10568 [Trypanosoma cruzi]|nr:hypothetical protein TcCL_NonESM10568 [Trypanosoma cruzi]